MVSLGRTGSVQNSSRHNRCWVRERDASRRWKALHPCVRLRRRATKQCPCYFAIEPNSLKSQGENNIIICVDFVGQELRQGNGEGSSLFYRVTRICWRLLNSHVLWRMEFDQNCPHGLSCDLGFLHRWQPHRTPYMAVRTSSVFGKSQTLGGPLSWLQTSHSITWLHSAGWGSHTLCSFKGRVQRMQSRLGGGTRCHFKTRDSKGRKLGLKGQLCCSASPRREQSGIEVGVLGAQPGEFWRLGALTTFSQNMRAGRLHGILNPAKQGEGLTVLTQNCWMVHDSCSSNVFTTVVQAWQRLPE